MLGKSAFYLVRMREPEPEAAAALLVRADPEIRNEFALSH
jgi:hypothetical protein